MDIDRGLCRSTLGLSCIAGFGTGRSMRKTKVNSRGIPAFCWVFSSSVHTSLVSGILVGAVPWVIASLMSRWVLRVEP